MIHPAATVVMARPVMTCGTFRSLTATCMTGTDAGPTFAAAGPMNSANRNADPNHRAPAMMWKKRNTRKNGDDAIMHPPSDGDGPRHTLNANADGIQKASSPYMAG